MEDKGVDGARASEALSALATADDAAAQANLERERALAAVEDRQGRRRLGGAGPRGGPGRRGPRAARAGRRRRQGAAGARKCIPNKLGVPALERNPPAARA